MEKRIVDDLAKLVDAGILSETKAEEIEHFFGEEVSGSSNRQFIVFGILGAILVGLGVILIIAHNWDELSRLAKTAIAFTPMMLAQGLALYTIVKKTDSRTWVESTATLLVFGVGAALAMISQIYNIPGDLASFMLTWSLLILPLVYLMPSAMAAVLYLLGITYYAVESGYGFKDTGASYYWMLLLFLAPYYYHSLKNTPKSNFTYLLNWLIPISFLLSLGTIARENSSWLFLAYMNLFGLFYLVGRLVPQFRDHWRNNGYLALGSIGTIVLLLTLSFRRLWEELSRANMAYNSIEFMVSSGIFIMAFALLVFTSRKQSKVITEDPTSIVFVLFALLLILALKTPTLVVVVINALVFTISMFIIKKAMSSLKLGLLNYGLLIMTALIVCRFFDTNISFVLRGMLFVLMGIGFFIANYRLIKNSQ